MTPSPTRDHDLNNLELTLPGDFQLKWPNKFDFLTFISNNIVFHCSRGDQNPTPIMTNHIPGDNDLKKLEFTLPEDVSNHVSASLNELFSRKRFLRSTEKNFKLIKEIKTSLLFGCI